ncbi:hypothetical protein WN55_06216 [Dufourea novaeangliae]|uniref:Uncharacterized protein n=1 Tax=Dufourea novaeangliae TaxID=178035 RepID=A0A154PRZ1_DUFNO|nr:hypothetical protein WN55_06216 [Dufourea novaeangliae]
MGHQSQYPRLRLDEYLDDRREPAPRTLAEAILPANDVASFQRRSTAISSFIAGLPPHYAHRVTFNHPDTLNQAINEAFKAAKLFGVENFAHAPYAQPPYSYAPQARPPAPYDVNRRWTEWREPRDEPDYELPRTAYTAHNSSPPERVAQTPDSTPTVGCQYDLPPHDYLGNAPDANSTGIETALVGEPEFDSTEDVTRPGNVQQKQQGYNNNLPLCLTTEEITFLRSLDQAEPSNNEDSTRNTKIQPPIAKKRVSWFLPPPTDLLELPQSTMVFAEPDESGITIGNVSNEHSTNKYTSSKPPIATVSHPSALTAKTPTDGSREGETNKTRANWQGAIKGIKHSDSTSPVHRQYSASTSPANRRHLNNTAMGHHSTYPRLRTDPHLDDRRIPGPSSVAEAILPARDQATFGSRRCVQGKALFNHNTNELLCGPCAWLESEEDLGQFYWGPQHFLMTENRAWHATRCSRCRNQVLIDKGNENCTGCLRAYLAVDREHRPAYPRLRAAPPRFEARTTDTGTQTEE